MVVEGWKEEVLWVGCPPLALVRTKSPPIPNFPFSHCLPLVFRCPAESYSPMRMGLFSCDYFVAIVQDVCPQGGDSGFVGAQRTKGT